MRNPIVGGSPPDDGRLPDTEGAPQGGASHQSSDEPVAGSPDPAAHYRTIFDNAEIGIVRVGPNRELLDVNPAFCTMLGYSRGELIGRGFDEFTHPGDIESNVALFNAAVRECRTRYALDKRYIRRDGSVVWCHVSGAAVRGAAGHVEQCVSVILDITDRKRVEAALRKSDVSYKLLLDTSPLAIITLDGQDRVLSWNAAAERIFGWSAGEVLGHRLPIATPEETAEFEREFDPQRCGVGGHGAASRRRRKDGSFVDVAIWTSPTRAADSRIISSLGIIADMTERRRIETALEASRRQYEALVHSIDGIVWEADASTFAFRFVSPQAERMLGYPLAAWYEPGFWAAHIHPADREWATDFCLRSTREQRDHAFEYRMLAADGSHIWLHDHTTVIVEKGAATLLRGVIIDITARKKLEEQLLHAQKMEAIGRLAGGVAHDFNNILTAILGYVEIAESKLAGRNGGDVGLAPIRDAAERAAELTRQLLAFARRQVLDTRPIDLNVVVGKLRGMLDRLLPTSITLVTNAVADLWHVYADAAQLEQLIVNLAVNARDAMPAGGALTIALANERRTQDDDARTPLPAGDYVRLTVRDTGTGIDPLLRERIFEPFFTTKPPGEGTGLGLASAHGFVTQLGGRIDVESAAGEGTAFHVLLRRAPAEVAAASVPAQRRTRGAETILLVEDESIVRDVAHAALLAHGYRVLVSTNGAEALQLAAAHAGAIDLLLTDVAMPKMSGAELSETLRTIRPGLRVLFTSGYSDDPKFHTFGTDSPETAFLPKPYTPDALAARVRDVLDRSI